MTEETPVPIGVSGRPERTLKLTIEYDGTDFHGWQSQPEVRTVQGTLVEALRSVTGEPVEAPGASRTDAGVHALAQVAHVRTRSPIPVEKFGEVLNGRLSADVRVVRVEEVDASFHARFSAVGKHYRYWIDRASLSSAFLARWTLPVRAPLDLPAMRRAGSLLEGEHDFAAFACDSGAHVDPPVTTVRTIYRIGVEEQGRLLVFDVWGRSFLYKMVRTLVGSLLEVGRGRWALSRLEACLASRDRRSGGPTLPPRGLCLDAVLYDPGSLAGVRGGGGALPEEIQKSFPWATL